MIDKKWQKLENLKNHDALTTRVKRRLQKEKEALEKKLGYVNVLLEKPTKRGAIRM